MGDRYWLTGVQLGMLMAMSEQKDFKETKKLLAKIEKGQLLAETIWNDDDKNS